jgi:CheY-like chemotaxis protein
MPFGDRGKWQGCSMHSINGDNKIGGLHFSGGKGTTEMKAVDEKAVKKAFRILVVEDDPGMGLFMKQFCELNGYDADFATNGALALKQIENGVRYGLAVVDFLMPRMHGVEFILHALKKLPDLPIIAMSAYDDAEKPFREAGAYLFLKKPLDPYELEREVALIAGKGNR